MIRVLSLGAGVQSTTVLLMSCRGLLPKLDAAVFADTQWEPAAVYRHLDWLTAEAARHGVPVHRTTRGNLRQDTLDAISRKAGDGKRAARLPFFVTNPSGEAGMMRRQCTGDYKIEPIERFIKRTLLGLKPRQRGPKAAVVEQWFGISADEAQRVRKSTRPWCQYRYPLIKDVVSPRRPGLFEEGFSRLD